MNDQVIEGELRFVDSPPSVGLPVGFGPVGTRMWDITTTYLR